MSCLKVTLNKNNQRDFFFLFESLNCLFVCLFRLRQVTETRTGPLGCSNYDNLDSVSSVLVQSPENKVQLQGWSNTVASSAHIVV